MKDKIEIPVWVMNTLTRHRGGAWSFALVSLLVLEADFGLCRINAREVRDKGALKGCANWSRRRINNAKRAMLRAGVIVPARSGERHLYRLNWDRETCIP